MEIQHNQKQQQLMEQILSDQRYKGKHVIIADGQVFTANTGDGARKVLERIRKEFPGKTPAVTYIPDADLILT